jgi:hypothetical protein
MKTAASSGGETPQCYTIVYGSLGPKYEHCQLAISPFRRCKSLSPID